MSNQSAAFKSAAPAGGESLASDPWGRMADILKTINPPVFPPRLFDIRDFGASQDCTIAIREAIAACSAAGGGRVLVPAGEWLSGAVHLKSNVELHLAEGATLKFSQDPAAYLPLVVTRWEGSDLLNYSAFIYACEAENIAITGKGRLDGQADQDHWWNWDKKLRAQGKAAARLILHRMNDDGVPVEQRRFGEGCFLRPNLITFLRCRNVLIEDVTLLRSPMWHMHPMESQNVTIRRVTCESDGPNTDGCDPESCEGVLIEDCSFNTGNDCIAIKSGRNDDGRRRLLPSQGIIIRRCRMGDGHGGITLGSEIAGGVSDIFVEDCSMDSPNLRYAIRFKNNARRGGRIAHFHARRLDIGQVYLSVLRIDFHYEEGPDGLHMPSAQQVRLEGVRCAKCPRVAEIHGFTNALIEPVMLKDCHFMDVWKRSIVKDAPGLKLENVFANSESVTAV